MPTIARAELALQTWLQQHAPETASLCAQVAVRQAIRSEVQQRHPDMVHDLSFLRRESIRASLQRAGDSPDLAEPAFEVFFAERQNVVLYDGVLEALAKLAARYPLVSVSNGNADVFRTAAAPYFTAA
ncbi:MAG: HAD family hydrolase, partial [Limnohabitans sp.]|nr:HAD family hydrolase [Limnohabitans sp.]